MGLNLSDFVGDEVTVFLSNGSSLKGIVSGGGSRKYGSYNIGDSEDSFRFDGSCIGKSYYIVDVYEEYELKPEIRKWTVELSLELLEEFCERKGIHLTYCEEAIEELLREQV
jgi:hypothetical protein